MDRSESITTTLEIIDSGIPILPLSLMRPMALNMWWGPISDPVDQFLEVYIAAVDASSIPAQNALDEDNVWAAKQVWRAIGDPVAGLSVVQTMMRENTLFFSAPQIRNTEIWLRNVNFRLALIAIADQALTYAFMGSVTVEITLLRRIWSGPDNDMTDLSFEESVSWL